MSMPIIALAYFPVCAWPGCTEREGVWSSQRLCRHYSPDPSFNSSKVLPGSLLPRVCLWVCVYGCVCSDLKCIYSVACSLGNSQRDCQRWAMMGCTQTHTITHPHSYNVWASPLGAGDLHLPFTLLNGTEHRKAQIIMLWEIETRTEEEWSRVSRVSVGKKLQEGWEYTNRRQSSYWKEQ